MKESLHLFEVPLYTEPSRRFNSFIKAVEHPTVTSSLMGKYWKGRLSFICYTDGKKRETSVVPIPEHISKTRYAKLVKKVSIFTSKLNCSMSLLSKDCKIFIELAKPIEPDKELYGKDVVALIKVQVICKSTPAELALSSFFTVVESSPLNIGD